MNDTLIRLQSMGARVRLEFDPRYQYHDEKEWSCTISWSNPENTDDEVTVSRKGLTPESTALAAAAAFDNIATKGIPQGLLAPPIVGVLTPREPLDAEIPL